MNKLSPAEVHASALVIDTHADTPQRFVDEGWDFTGPLGTGMLNLETARRGNLAAEFFAIWAEPVEWKGRFAERTQSLIDAMLAQVSKHPQAMRLGVSPDDIETAHRDGIFCALMGIEGGHSIENSIDRLRDFYRQGVRYMTLTWSNSNEWADSSGDDTDPTVPHHGGLSDFGRDVVREMNRLGMMVDVSHVADSTFWDVLRTTRTPILASHSNARALTPVKRNLTDEMLRAIAANNGVVMVNFYSGFVDAAWRETWEGSRTERQKEHRVMEEELHAEGRPVLYGDTLQLDRKHAARQPRARFKCLIDHFDHIAQIAGIDHVGIGTDFDGMAHLPEGIDSAADLPKITEALMARGYTAEQMHKVLGGNLLRVFRDIEAARSCD